MQKFRVASAEAQRIAMEITHIVDEFRLKDGEAHDISEGYDLNNKANRLSLYRTLRNLEGQDYRAVLGAGTTLDRVKITRWRPDSCECVVTYLWRSDHPEDRRAHHPHRSESQCAHHKALKPHCHEHHAELWAENAHKNGACQALAEHLGVEEREIEWSHNVKRELVLDHPKLADKQTRVRAQAHVGSACPGRPARFKRA